jgi:hypothetical protein
MLALGLKSVFVGIISAWIIFPTIIFANDAISGQRFPLNPLNQSECEKGCADERGHYIYRMGFFGQYFEYVIVLPLFFLFNLLHFTVFYPFETILFFGIFYIISSLYFIHNYKFKYE